MTPDPGAQVTVGSGRYAGKSGVLVRYDLIQSGQLRLYPVVRLDGGREVRVVEVQPRATSQETTEGGVRDGA